VTTLFQEIKLKKEVSYFSENHKRAVTSLVCRSKLSGTLTGRDNDGPGAMMSARCTVYGPPTALAQSPGSPVDV